VNVPLPAGSTDADYLEAFRRVLVPIADDYKPWLVIVSAGYDPVEGDPLGDMRMTPAGFQKLAYTVRAMGNAGVVALLEGGYSGQLPACVAASIRGFLGEDTDVDPATTPARAHIDEAVRVQRQYWRL
jgi:acetoin utilization deacetylase AcuC-like enzyme